MTAMQSHLTVVLSQGSVSASIPHARTPRSDARLYIGWLSKVGEAFEEHRARLT